MPVEKDGQKLGPAQPSAPRPTVPPPSTAADEAQARQQLLGQVQVAETRFSGLHDDAQLTSIRDELEDISSNLAALPARLERVRSRGFVYQSFLESDLKRLPMEWSRTKSEVTYEMAQETNRLAQAMAQTQAAVLAARQQLALPLAQSSARVAQVNAQIESLESNIRAAQTGLRGSYDAAAKQVADVQSQIADAETMLDELDAASFKLYPKEAPVAMTQGEWLRGKDDEMKGLVFITDQRLIFERKEEVVTKRRLLVFTEKKLVRELSAEMPIGAVKDVQVQRVGTIFKKSVLDLGLMAPPAPFGRMSLTVKGDTEAWQRLVSRVITGELDKERVKVAEEAEAKAQEPTVLKCSQCGSTITTPIVKGMKSVTCEYCGNVIRL